MRIQDVPEHIPQSVQTLGNWGSVGAAVSSFVGIIQGPLAVIASLLSICWLGLQIYSWFANRKRGK